MRLPLSDPFWNVCVVSGSGLKLIDLWFLESSWLFLCFRQRTGSWRGRGTPAPSRPGLVTGSLVEGREGCCLWRGGVGGAPATLLSLPAASPLARPLAPVPAHGQWRGDLPAPALVSAAGNSRQPGRHPVPAPLCGFLTSLRSGVIWAEPRGPHPVESLEPLTLQSPLSPLNTCHLPSHSATQGPASPHPSLPR